MTIEFWLKRLLRPKPRRVTEPKARRARRPKLPVPVGKVQQMLSGAIICGDHELASWIDLIVKRGQVTGKPEHLDELKTRLDAVMQPLPDPSPPTADTPSPVGHPASGAVLVS